MKRARRPSGQLVSDVHRLARVRAEMTADPDSIAAAANLAMAVYVLGQGDRPNKSMPRRTMYALSSIATHHIAVTPHEIGTVPTPSLDYAEHAGVAVVAAAVETRPESQPLALTAAA